MKDLDWLDIHIADERPAKTLMDDELLSGLDKDEAVRRSGRSKFLRGTVLHSLVSRRDARLGVRSRPLGREKLGHRADEEPGGAAAGRVLSVPEESVAVLAPDVTHPRQRYQSAGCLSVVAALEEAIVIGGRRRCLEPTVARVLHDQSAVFFPKRWSALHSVVNGGPPLEVLAYDVVLWRRCVATLRRFHLV
jgi:hypothetical protein